MKFNKCNFIPIFQVHKGEQLLVFLTKFMSVNVQDLNTYVSFSFSIQKHNLEKKKKTKPKHKTVKYIHICFIFTVKALDFINVADSTFFHVMLYMHWRINTYAWLLVKISVKAHCLFLTLSY